MATTVADVRRYAPKLTVDDSVIQGFINDAVAQNALAAFSDSAAYTRATLYLTLHLMTMVYGMALSGLGTVGGQQVKSVTVGQVSTTFDNINGPLAGNSSTSEFATTVWGRLYLRTIRAAVGPTVMVV